MSVGIYNGGLRGHCLRIKKDHVVCVCVRERVEGQYLVGVFRTW